MPYDILNFDKGSRLAISKIRPDLAYSLAVPLSFCDGMWGKKVEGRYIDGQLKGGTKRSETQSR